VIKILAIFFALWSVSANAQAIQQSGSVTPGHAWKVITNGVAGDAGTAANPAVTSFGTVGSGPTFCTNSGPITGPYNALCFGATQTGGGVVSLYNYGGATGGLAFSINGAAQGFGLVNLPVTANDYACIANTSGNLKDCGVSPVGTVYGPGTSNIGCAAPWANTTGSLLGNNCALSFSGTSPNYNIQIAAIPSGGISCTIPTALQAGTSYGALCQQAANTTNTSYPVQMGSIINFVTGPNAGSSPEGVGLFVANTVQSGGANGWAITGSVLIQPGANNGGRAGEYDLVNENCDPGPVWNRTSGCTAGTYAAMIFDGIGASGSATYANETAIYIETGNAATLYHAGMTIAPNSVDLAGLADLSASTDIIYSNTTHTALFKLDTSGALTNGLDFSAGTVSGCTIKLSAACVIDGSGNIIPASFVFGTGGTETIEATSANTGHANNFIVNNSGTGSNVATAAVIQASINNVSNGLAELYVQGGTTPVAVLTTGAGITEGFFISSGSGPLSLASPVATGTATFPDSSTLTSAGLSSLVALGVGETAPSAGNVNISGAYKIGGVSLLSVASSYSELSDSSGSNAYGYLLLGATVNGVQISGVQTVIASTSGTAYLTVTSTSTTIAGGLAVGAPTGGAEGTGTVNSAGAYYANGTKGVTCSGALTVVSSVTIKNGIITAATGTGGTCS
jgi:hypothetical protein